MSRLRSLFVCLAALVPATAAFGHEFWIAPEAYVVAEGQQLQAQIKVGEEFKGSGYSYNPNRFERFDLVRGDVVSAVEGRLGDTPALNMAAEQDGLVIVVHETTDSLLTYTEWAKFEKFAMHKAFTQVLAEHEARGLPKDKFVERYRRFAKSLIAVGDGAGQDRSVGLRTEIVALDNPYTDAGETVRVQVLMEGKPRGEAQVELFARAPDGEVTVTLHTTDTDGTVVLPVSSGFDYLVDAVVMLPLDADDPASDPTWYSLWASLTFSVPQK